MFNSTRANDYRAQFLVPLGVLLWKYKLGLTYRYCHSILEIFGGISVFFIVFLVHQTSFTPLPTQEAVEDTSDTITRVFYSPYNNFTRRLMTRVENMLTKNESGVLTKLRWDFESKDLPPNTNSYDPNDLIAAVQFKNNGSATPVLDYTINVISLGRKKNKLYTIFDGFFHSFAASDENAPPYLGKLQMAIDKAFIEMLSDTYTEQDVRLLGIPSHISNELHTLQKFMILCTILGPLPFFLAHCSRLIVERRSGLRELMKLSGIHAQVLRLSHIVETTIIAIIYVVPIIILLKMSSRPILPRSNPVILAFSLILHFLNTTSLSFITTALSQDIQHAESVGLLLYVSTFVLDFMWYSYKEFTFVSYLLCVLMPHAPIYLFWDEVLYLESIGQGTNFGNIWVQHSHDCMSVLWVWLLLHIQLAVINILAWYLDFVRPGRYGVSKKWNFFMKKSYWRPSLLPVKIKEPEEIDEEKKDPRYFEEEPHHAEVAIQVTNVSKVYKKFTSKIKTVALDSVNFNCYRGEITMLLGANGAGKTTLISIIAGMFSPTSGTVHVNGVDVGHKVTDQREVVGLCMQENLCFENLTVEENITFFKKLKRIPSEGFTVDQLMRILKLSDVSDYYSKQLCSGLRRCLQVACTLAGDADVLVLDEPTTGMAVEIRHRLWDLLMILRGKKTILMATSFLEEANALGDRIVILNDGELKCHGTPAFLKHAIGTSFNLSITIRDSTQMRHLKDMVHVMLPHLHSRIHDPKRITFSLPDKEYKVFPQLFQALESRKDEFGITLMDVGMFMEDVFLEFIDEKTKFIHYTVEGSVSCRHINMERATGCALRRNKMKLLTQRVYQFLFSKKYQVLGLRVMVPILGILIVNLTSNHALRYYSVFNHHILRQHTHDVKALVYTVGPFRRRGLIDAMDKYPGVNLLYSLDIDGEFEEPTAGYQNKETMGIKMTDNYTNVYHPMSPQLASKAINLYSNIYLKMFMPYLNGSIHTSYAPLKLKVKDEIVEPKTTFLCVKWTCCVTYLVIIPLIPFIILCMKEHNTGTRDNHIMAGCSPLEVWGSKLIAHMSVYMSIIVIPVIILSVALDFDKTFAQVRFIGSLFAFLFCFGPTYMTFLYHLSFMLHEHLAISQIYIASMFVGVIIPILVSVLEPIWDTSPWIAVPYLALVIVGRFSPLFVLGVGLTKLTTQARLNAYCNLNRHLCPNLDSDDVRFNKALCCELDSAEPFAYLNSYDSGMYDLLNMVALFVYYGSLVLLLENRIPQYIYEQFFFTNYKQPEQLFNDISVRKERTYIRNILRTHTYDNDILIADNLHKDFANDIRGKHMYNLVRGVSFTAKLGECFAILGPQGTGKSSILNMLAGNIVMTRGNSCVDKHFIRSNRLKYMQKICLSSAHCGMDGFMSGHQNLVFIAGLMGYNKQMARNLSHMALRYLNIHQGDLEVSKYSMGFLRRLSLCSALVMAPSVAFLDEPMRDIDASTKPLIARTLQRLMFQPTAVIVAETSVDWRYMQPVYSRIALLSKGQFAAIGPAEDIIKSLATGYMARIKLKLFPAYRRNRYRLYDDDFSTDSMTRLEEERSDISVIYEDLLLDLKKEFVTTFETSKLTAEHMSMLYFYIKDEEKRLLYSDMFSKLQIIKEKYSQIVEDYTLSVTSIEDVFWRLEYDRQADLPLLTPSKHNRASTASSNSRTSDFSPNSQGPTLKDSVL